MRILAQAVATVALCAVLFPAVATAQDELDERARTHFQAGTSYFEAAQYEDALREFEEAYRLSNRVGLLYNVAISHERLGHWSEAADYLERYLEQQPDIDNREVLELKVRNLRERSAQGQTGTGTETGTGTGTETGTGSGTGTGAGTGSETTGGGGFPVPAIVSFAAAGVGAVLWATFGILAISEDSRLGTDCAAMPCTDDDVGTLRAFDLVADIGFGVTLLGAALGTIFFLTMRGEDGAEPDTAAVSPWVGPSGGGVSVRGTL